MSTAVATGGRKGGAGNYKPAEDACLTTAFLTASTDAAVGTDQSSLVLWAKVKRLFEKEMGTSLVHERGIESLKSRWSNTLRFALNKYGAALTRSFKVYKSGWTIDDYTKEAKKIYADENPKEFTHEKCWEIVKDSPKFACDMTHADSRIKAALALDNPPPSTGEEDDDSSVEGNTPKLLSFTTTPRPSIGKKKAKAAKQFKTGTPAISAQEAQVQVLARIATTGEKKQCMMEQQLKLQEREVKAKEDEVKTKNGQVEVMFFKGMEDCERKRKYLEMKADSYLLALALENTKAEMANDVLRRESRGKENTDGEDIIELP